MTPWILGAVFATALVGGWLVREWLRRRERLERLARDVYGVQRHLGESDAALRERVLARLQQSRKGTADHVAREVQRAVPRAQSVTISTDRRRPGVIEIELRGRWWRPLRERDFEAAEQAAMRATPAFVQIEIRKAGRCG